MRVVSLLAAATEMVCALDAGEALVGRSHECDNPGWVRGLPSCSEPAFDVSVSSAQIDAEVRRRLQAGEPLYRVDMELMRDLQPDLVITQSHCNVCAVTLADLQQTRITIPARQLSLSAFTLEQIFENVQAVADTLDLTRRGHEVIERERLRLERVRQRTAALGCPTVVILEWVDPIFAMGNWGPELARIANCEPLLGRPGEFSKAIAGEQLRDADPEWLIVAPCGFNLTRAEREQDVLESYPWWRGLRAVREGNVAFADGNLFFNRSGLTVSRTAEIMAEIIHGVSFGIVPEETQWRRMTDQVTSAGHG